MKRSRASSFRSTAVLGLVTLLGVAFAGDGPQRLTTRASLAFVPGGPAALDLPAGTAVAVLERRGEWTRVLVEGWVPASALDSDSAAAAPSMPPSPPPIRNDSSTVVAPSAPGTAVASGFLEGTIRLDTKWLRKRKGAGAKVWLIPASVSLDADGRNAEEEKRLSAIDAEIDSLEAEAAQALEKAAVMTDGSRQHDDIMARRDKKIDERRDILASLHGGHESVAQQSAVATTTADSEGSYRLAAASEGRYTLYARFTRGSVDVEWMESVMLRVGSVRADLDETNARHLISGAN